MFVSCVFTHPRDVATFCPRKNVPDEGEKLPGIPVRELGQGVDSHSLDQKFSLPGGVYGFPFAFSRLFIVVWKKAVCAWFWEKCLQLYRRRSNGVGFRTGGGGRSFFSKLRRHMRGMSCEALARPHATTVVAAS